MSIEEEPPSESGAAAGSRERQLDFHPAIAMRWEITRSTADTGGELFEATNWLDPKLAGPPVHVHPTAEESYEVTEGALDIFVDGEWRTLRAGETATVPAGVPHTLRNATTELVRLINIHRPALQFESFFREMHALTQQGKIKRLPPKEPRSAIYVAMLFTKYPNEIRATKPPNAVFKALALVGMALRFKLEP
jgi:mannose-6-phosphate isomerase-like protein (cupin superfamily)